MLQAMDRLGYAAANVAERDLKAGYASLAERAAVAGFPLVSANIVRRDTGEPVFAPHVLTRAVSADGRRAVSVGLIGAARFNPIFRKPGPEGTDLQILHPLEPVRKSITALQGQGAEVIVLLAALHREDARRMLADLPGIDFVVGSYGGFFGTVADPASGAWLLYSGNQGKRLGETRIFLEGEGQRAEPVHRLHYLLATYPEDAGMRDYLLEAAAAEAQRQASTAEPAQAAGSPYAGPSGCRSCHAGAYEQWDSTPHARAFASLEREGEHERPACLACHTTGAGVEGGFTGPQATPEMARVGCEACHGPGSAHAAAPSAPYGAVELSTCTGCHDLENSPEFDYYSYRSRIVHGERDPR